MIGLASWSVSVWPDGRWGSPSSRNKRGIVRSVFAAGWWQEVPGLPRRPEWGAWGSCSWSAGRLGPGDEDLAVDGKGEPAWCQRGKVTDVQAGVVGRSQNAAGGVGGAGDGPGHRVEDPQLPTREVD